MTNEDFNKLKQWYLTKPSCGRSTYSNSLQGRMSDFYREVRQRNWDSSFDKPQDTQETYEE